MPETPLRGPKLKIERAKRHIHDLHSVIVTFIQSNPYRMFEEDNPDGVSKNIKVQLRGRIPDDIGLIAADAVHNLRVSLDQMACRLAEANGVSSTAGVYFPFGKDAQIFEAQIKEKIKKLHPDAIDMIRGLKAYPGGNDLLWSLNELDITDKHREIVAIGMLEVDTESGCVYFQNGGKKQEKSKEDEITFISGTEEEILKLFWKQMARYSQFITFYGRIFDCPYIMIRSAIHKLPAKKNLCPYRYAHNVHIDLADQLSFYDALRKKFSLHMWCRALQIESPKEEGVDGARVKGLFEDQHYHDIARYCIRDVRATKALFQYWDKFLKF